MAAAGYDEATRALRWTAGAGVPEKNLLRLLREHAAPLRVLRVE